MPAQAGKHNVADSGLEDALSMSDSIIEVGAFFQFSLVECVFAQEKIGGFAAAATQGVKFVSDPGRAADRECGMMFSRSHAVKITDL